MRRTGLPHQGAGEIGRSAKSWAKIESVGIVSDLPTGPVPYDERPRRRAGAGVPFMTAPERDEKIVRLRRRGENRGGAVAV